MAIMHRDRPLAEWPGSILPERWRRVLDLDPEQEGWLRVEEFRDGDRLVLRAELPGVDPDKDVTITLDDGVLSIRAQREEKEERRNKRGYRSEFRYGAMARTLRLPEGVRPDDVKATYEDGILQVVVPVPSEPPRDLTTIPVTKR